MAAWEGNADFREALTADAEVTDVLPAAELDALFDLAHHTRHVEQIFGRVFGE
jgi:adenylosuccinate lyase